MRLQEYHQARSELLSGIRRARRMALEQGAVGRCPFRWLRRLDLLQDRLVTLRLDWEEAT